MFVAPPEVTHEAAQHPYRDLKDLHFGIQIKVDILDYESHGVFEALVVAHDDKRVERVYEGERKPSHDVCRGESGGEIQTVSVWLAGPSP